MAGRHSAAPGGDDARGGHPSRNAAEIRARHAASLSPAPSGGRRYAPRGGGSRPWRRILLGAAAVATVAGSLVVAATWPDAPSTAGPNAAGGCRGEEMLRVIAAPGIAPAISAIANDWQAVHPAVNGICVRVSVTSKESVDAEQELLGVSNATLWIPDSTVWSARLLSDAPALSSILRVGPSVAKSPLVAAVVPARAAGLTAAAKHGWAGLLTGKTRVVLPDPTTTTEGALTLLGLEAELGPSRVGRDNLGSTFLQLSGHVMPNAAAGFASVKDFPDVAPAFVASEQEVLDSNEGQAAPVTAAVYPSGTSAALDFPLVVITPSRVQILADAVHEFERELAQPAASHALNAVNLRDTSAAPITDTAEAAGSVPLAVKLAPPATQSSLTSVLRRWVAAGEPNQLLAVIDVSGSMNDDSGNGRSKIHVASDAAGQAATLMPDSWSVGLWTFSLRPPPAHDYTELVPVGPVSANRSELVAATRTMPSLVGGDTGLYSTALDAYKSVRDHYAPHKANAVVLMTDGANVDPDDGDLPTVLAELKAAADPKRPVSIITIALGKDADVAALKQISAATGGTTYVVRAPEEIRTVFVQIALRGA